jgi:hypothetical protein
MVGQGHPDSVGARSLLHSWRKVTGFRQAPRRKSFVLVGRLGFFDVTLLFSGAWEEKGGGVGYTSSSKGGTDRGHS